MSPSPKPVSAYSFGEFRLNAQDRILERNGARVLLTPKVIDILFVLVQNAGQLVTKESLMKAVWPDVTVVESGLTRNISVLRKALEEDAPEGLYVETIPRRGYRFVANVTQQYCEPDPLPQPAIETLLSPTRTAIETAPSKTKAFPFRWLTIAAVVLLVSLAWFILRPTRPTANRTSDRMFASASIFFMSSLPNRRFARWTNSNKLYPRPRTQRPRMPGLSIALLQMPLLGLRALAEIVDRAEADANRALELDPNLASAHYAAGLVSLFHHRHFDQAEKHLTRALELDPTSVQARLGYTQLKFARAK